MAQPRALSIDPLLALALALQSTPGGYALLVGSGISRAAGVPTGWEVVEDLIRRVATAEDRTSLTDAEASPASWYRSRFKAEPSYSVLLEQVAGTPAERREVLRAYFEPSASDREQGLKVPTRAHRAIANLVRLGFVRVILTTNFDQLIEAALREQGVVPAVISSPDAVSGMMPLHLSPVSIIKLHGDYLDTRLKNTPEELIAYDPPINQVLDRVFDEYGLIVCGWSGTWDTALRDAIVRCPSRRFSTFWLSQGAPSVEAQLLIEHRRARVVSIASADLAFESLIEKVESLSEIERPHPVSTAVAIATLKRYLPVPDHRIRLDDLVAGEVERVLALLPQLIPYTTQPRDYKHVVSVLPKIEAASTTAVSLFANGVFWGEAHHQPLWIRLLERLAASSRPHAASGGVVYPAWDRLFRYSAQLAFYAGGIAAVALGNRGHETLGDLLLAPRIRLDASDPVANPAIALNLSETVEHDVAKHIPGYEQRRTPFSDYLFEHLRPVLRPIVPDDALYADIFDRFEYLTALVYADNRERIRKLGFWAPVGRLAWRRERYPPSTAASDIAEESKREGANWFLFRRGVFGGSQLVFDDSRRKLDELLIRRGF
jgi:hypothetical protein